MEGGYGGGFGVPVLVTAGHGEKGPHTDVPVPAPSPARWLPRRPSHPPPRRHPAFGISLLPSGSRRRGRTRGCPPQNRVRAPGSHRVTMAATCGSQRKGPSAGASWLANWPKSGTKMPRRATREGCAGRTLQAGSPLPAPKGSAVGFGNVSALKIPRCPFSEPCLVLSLPLTPPPPASPVTPGAARPPRWGWGSVTPHPEASPPQTRALPAQTTHTARLEKNRQKSSLLSAALASAAPFLGRRGLWVGHCP